MKLWDFSFSEESRSATIRVFVEFGILALAVGFLASDYSYFAGFLAGVSSNCFAIAFAVWAVSRYDEGRRKAMWSRVRALANAEVSFSLWNVAAEAVRLFKLHVSELATLLDLCPGGGDRTSEALAVASEELGKVAATLEAAGQDWHRALPFRADEALEDFMKATSVRCEHVQSVLLPLLIAASGDVPLVESLVWFGQGYRRLEARLKEVDVSHSSPPVWLPTLVRYVAELLKRAAGSYQLVKERRTKSDPRDGARSRL
jgi:hypothetical protein